jgi:hemerythrin-like domain-containing protein
MEPTELLMEEHRVIERLLATLDRAASRLEMGEDVRPGVFLDAADVIKGFADGCHHRKEEGILFPALEQAGVPRDGGPVGVLLAEHEEGRRLTRAMRQAAELVAGGDVSARSAVVGNARGYTGLLKQHIKKEDTVLFPLAVRVVQGHKRTEMAEAFEVVEREETGEGAHEKYLGMVEALEREIAPG